MRILMACAEYAPLAKTGGLADAVAGLSGALYRRGHDVRVLMPRYGVPEPEGWSVKPDRAGAEPYIELLAPEPGPRVFLQETPETHANGAIYTGDDRDAPRFLALCRAACAMPDALGWRPDVVHCHDWHAALVPALLERDAEERAPPPRSMLTLHNISYQGNFAESVLADCGGGDVVALAGDAGRANSAVSFLRIGIERAGLVTTVSPTYAREIRTPGEGMGLDAALRERGESFLGVLNGVDYRVWSPETDALIGTNFDSARPEGKQDVKRALCAELGLTGDRPVLGVVTRLVEQKGVDLLVDALPALLERTRACFALLGSGDPALEGALAALAAAHPERIAFARGYDEGLAHRIIAGSDLLLVPSRYEPCGLTQMYALRYGTVPVVRATGGLADTVAHFDPDAGTGNGCVFEHADPEAVIWGVTTALGWYEQGDAWRELMTNAMAADFSWDRQAARYETLYGALTGAGSSGGGARS